MSTDARSTARGYPEPTGLGRPAGSFAVPIVGDGGGHYVCFDGTVVADRVLGEQYDARGAVADRWLGHLPRSRELVRESLDRGKAT